MWVCFSHHHVVVHFVMRHHVPGLTFPPSPSGERVTFWSLYVGQAALDTTLFSFLKLAYSSATAVTAVPSVPSSLHKHVFSRFCTTLVMARLFELQLDLPQHLCHRWSHSSPVLAVLESSTPKMGAPSMNGPRRRGAPFATVCARSLAISFSFLMSQKKTVADLHKTLHHNRRFHLPALAHCSIDSFLFLAGLPRNTALQNVIGTSGDI